MNTLDLNRLKYRNTPNTKTSNALQMRRILKSFKLNAKVTMLRMLYAIRSRLSKLFLNCIVDFLKEKKSEELNDDQKEEFLNFKKKIKILNL